MWVNIPLIYFIIYHNIINQSIFRYITLLLIIKLPCQIIRDIHNGMVFKSFGPTKQQMTDSFTNDIRNDVHLRAKEWTHFPCTQYSKRTQNNHHGLYMKRSSTFKQLKFKSLVSDMQLLKYCCQWRSLISSMKASAEYSLEHLGEKKCLKQSSWS